MIAVRITLVLLMSFFFASCANVTSTTGGSFEGGEKEVYVRPGTLRVLGPIKETFIKNGWTVNEFEKEQSRYFVHINTKKVQMLCWNENSEMEVELVLLDQKLKKSIFSITAQTCDNYENLTNELNNILKELD